MSTTPSSADKNSQLPPIIRRDVDSVESVSPDEEAVKDLATLKDTDAVRGGASPIDGAPVKLR